MLEMQIINDHVPTQPYPAPAEPDHLALVRLRHGAAGRPITLAAPR